MKLYLIRHGESVTNKTHQFAGQWDVPLTALGCEQARCVAQFFKDIPLDAVYSSDLSRAVDTMRPTADAQGLTVIPEAGLREIYAGEWEGRVFEELPTLYPEDYKRWLDDIGAARCTGGESMAEACLRADAVLRRIAEAHPEGTVAVASHGGVIRGVLTLWETGSIAAMRERPWVPNASVTEAEYADARFHVLRSGETAHLGELVTELPKTV